jgi:hypothetical protein
MTVAKTKKSIAANKVEATAIDQIESLFADLPEKPQENVSLREAIADLREPLKASLAKGYSYDELTKILNDNGIEIRASTLKHYLATAQKLSSSRTRKTSSRRVQKSA